MDRNSLVRRRSLLKGLGRRHFFRISHYLEKKASESAFRGAGARELDLHSILPHDATYN